jgi:putative transposase
MVILPVHIQAIWTLPPDDADYSIRWRNIKRTFTQKIEPVIRPTVFGSRQRKGVQAIWQRRFWEHSIHTECDFNHHIDYIHYNPVKHGLVMRPVNWQYSSIHRYIQQGILTPDWGADCVINIPDATGYE